MSKHDVIYFNTVEERNAFVLSNRDTHTIHTTYTPQGEIYGAVPKTAGYPESGGIVIIDSAPTAPAPHPSTPTIQPITVTTGDGSKVVLDPVTQQVITVSDPYQAPLPKPLVSGSTEHILRIYVIPLPWMNQDLVNWTAQNSGWLIQELTNLFGAGWAFKSCEYNATNSSVDFYMDKLGSPLPPLIVIAGVLIVVGLVVVGITVIRVMDNITIETVTRSKEETTKALLEAGADPNQVANQVNDIFDMQQFAGFAGMGNIINMAMIMVPLFLVLGLLGSVKGISK